MQPNRTESQSRKATAILPVLHGDDTHSAKVCASSSLCHYLRGTPVGRVSRCALRRSGFHLQVALSFLGIAMCFAVAVYGDALAQALAAAVVR